MMRALLHRAFTSPPGAIINHLLHPG
jgi:hypothetical protein